MKKTRFIPKIGERYWFVLVNFRLDLAHAQESIRNEFQTDAEFLRNCWKTKAEAEKLAKTIDKILEN